jgi:hypothetical protein
MWDSCIRGANKVATIQCIPIAFKAVINALFGLAAVVAIFFIVFSGIKFLTSGGDPTKVEQARKTMTYAITGLIVIVLSFAIIRLIANVTDTECINRFNLVDCQ